MGWGQGGCVQRIKVIVKKQKKNRRVRSGGPVGRGSDRGGSGRGGGGGGGVRVDMYKELIEVIGKMKKSRRAGGYRGRIRGWELVGGMGDVNQE